MPEKFYIVEPEREYEARRGELLTAHGLADFRKCPLLYRLKQAGEIQEADSPHYAFGRAVHTRILMGEDAYNRSYALGGPVNEKTGKPYGIETKAFSEWAQQQGKPVLTNEQDATISGMALAISCHTMASALLSREHGVAEVTVRAKAYGHDAQSRLDWVRTDIGALIDLKTCASLDRFYSDAKEYGYHNQMAFYRDICVAAGWRPREVTLVAVEKARPYRVCVFVFSDKTLEVASALNMALGNELAECIDLDEWPTRYEEPRSLEID